MFFFRFNETKIFDLYFESLKLLKMSIVDYLYFENAITCTHS